MKIRMKITAVFAAAFIICGFLVVGGLTFVLDSLSSKMLKKQAENITMFLKQRIVYESAVASPKEFAEEVLSDFGIAMRVAEESRGFEIKKILLINEKYIVEAGYPEDEIGSDYSSHEDITENFRLKTTETVIELTGNESGEIEKYIDVVTFLTLHDKKPMVLEVKLDFAKSIALLESQYAFIEISAIILSVILLVCLLVLLLAIITKTAVLPVLRVNNAMQKVSSGDLEVKLVKYSSDEFGMLAESFNEMVRGLKEKFSLYKYVSKGTINAVKSSLVSGTEHLNTRKAVTLFFSDIRGFTTFSESREPDVVIQSLNIILSVQSESIKKYGGDIDKYVGDEIMALFRNPVMAIAAALEIQKKMEKIKNEINNLGIGISVHTGEVVAGDVGSEDHKDYTVIGDTVNTAARLQAAALAGEVVISEAVYNSPGIRDLFNVEYKDNLVLKGKALPVKTYKVISKKKQKTG